MSSLLCCLLSGHWIFCAFGGYGVQTIKLYLFVRSKTTCSTYSVFILSGILSSSSLAFVSRIGFFFTFDKYLATYDMFKDKVTVGLSHVDQQNIIVYVSLNL